MLLSGLPREGSCFCFVFSKEDGKRRNSQLLRIQRLRDCGILTMNGTTIPHSSSRLQHHPGRGSRMIVKSSEFGEDQSKTLYVNKTVKLLCMTRPSSSWVHSNCSCPIRPAQGQVSQHLSVEKEAGLWALTSP